MHKDHLRFALEPIEVGREGVDMAFVNSKGFGGNNATALVLAPHVVRGMLRARHGAKAMAESPAKTSSSS